MSVAQRLCAVWVTNRALARLMNFLLELDGHMPVVVELQLHLRAIYELKVGLLLFQTIAPLTRNCTGE